MKEKAKNIGCAILVVLFFLIWLILIFGTYTERPDFADSPDEAIRTK